jgi:hypothetical protein
MACSFKAVEYLCQDERQAVRADLPIDESRVGWIFVAVGIILAISAALIQF